MRLILGAYGWKGLFPVRCEWIFIVQDDPIKKDGCHPSFFMGSSYCLRQWISDAF